MGHVMLGDRLRAEITILQSDPIIKAIYEELKKGGISPKDEILKPNSMDFVSAVGKEYKRRGGDHQLTIGGPARAVIELERQDDEKSEV